MASFAFDPGDDGLQKFVEYLNATENTPVRILVDVIEEDFRKETVPHLGAKDRKAVLNRLMERHYRKSVDFYYHRVIGRETAGRRDDNLLVGVLTNPDILQPWMKAIEDAQTAVVGIWSLPLISEKLVKKIARDDKNVLLVSQQVPSNLRQSYFKNGEFQSSRSAVVNLEDTPLGEYISDEVEQTIRFLANQRFIGFDEKLSVHVICRDADIEKIQQFCEDSPLRTYIYHSLNKLQQEFGCTDVTEDYSNGLYSFICNKQIIPKGHYGPVSLFRYFYQHLVSKAMYASSLILLIASILVMLSYISDAQIMEAETDIINKQTVVMENSYTKELEKLEPRLEKTEAMKSSVLLNNKIIKSRVISPQNFMVDISRLFTLSGMNDTQITEIDWQHTQTNELNERPGQTRQAVNYGSTDVIKQRAVVRGFIRISDSSLKDTVNKINSIVAAFENHKMVEQVEITKMPIDTRSKNSLENESGTRVEESTATDSEKGRFELRLIMKGRQA
ncbi:MAG: hypothetical protein OQL06_01995 [Gammaproteobacteria bacterium]|nr:hypothetical protein [Gammaproteobacteria bacterium]